MAKVRAIGLASVTALLVAVFAQVAASSTSSPKAQSVTRGGTLVAARAADVVLWDPAHINENDSLWAAFQTNGNLIMTTPDGKGFQPYIARSWKTSNGGKVFTFQIDPNAKFCDGTAITAQRRRLLLQAREHAEGDRQLAVPEGHEDRGARARTRW